MGWQLPELVGATIWTVASLHSYGFVYPVSYFTVYGHNWKNGHLYKAECFYMVYSVSFDWKNICGKHYDCIVYSVSQMKTATCLLQAEPDFTFTFFSPWRSSKRLLFCNHGNTVTGAHWGQHRQSPDTFRYSWNVSKLNIIRKWTL